MIQPDEHCRETIFLQEHLSQDELEKLKRIKTTQGKIQYVVSHVKKEVELFNQMCIDKKFMYDYHSLHNTNSVKFYVYGAGIHPMHSSMIDEIVFNIVNARKDGSTLEFRLFNDRIIFTADISEDTRLKPIHLDILRTEEGFFQQSVLLEEVGYFDFETMTSLLELAKELEPQQQKQNVWDFI